MLYLTKRMDALDEDVFEFKLKRKHFSYWSWLAKEIFKANIDVSKVILSPKMNLSPRLVRVPLSQSNELATVIYAELNHLNSRDSLCRYRGRRNYRTRTYARAYGRTDRR